MSTLPSSAIPLTWIADQTLPISEQPPAAMPAATSLPPTPNAGTPEPGAVSEAGLEVRARTAVPTVLVVDDEPSIADLLGEFLTSEGYRTVVAHNGHDALLFALRERPALILSDWMMPGMDGTQFVCELRRRPVTACIPIVVMSSVRPDLSHLPAVPFLPKPFELDDVLDVVVRATRPDSLSTRLHGEG